MHTRGFNVLQPTLHYFDGKHSTVITTFSPEARRHHLALLGAAATEDLATQAAVVPQPGQGLEGLMTAPTGGRIAAQQNGATEKGSAVEQVHGDAVHASSDNDSLI